MSNNKGVDLLAAALVGAAAGAITALLLAPDKGLRTRRKLVRKVRELNAKMEYIASKGRESLQSVAEDAQDSLSELAKKGKKLMS